MCEYQGREFGAGYLDSVCIAGYLWDADSGDTPGELTHGGDIPCPRGNHAEWEDYYSDDTRKIPDTVGAEVEIPHKGKLQLNQSWVF